MSNILQFIMSVDTASGTTELKKFDQALRNTAKVATETGSGASKALETITFTLKQALLAGIGFGSGLNAVNVVTTLGGWAAAAVETGLAFNSLKQQVQIGFGTMLGSAKEATAYLERLQDFANTTPFEFPDLLKASQRLMAMGFAARDVRPLLTAVGDAAAGLGAGSEAINRITLALGQMQGRGKVATQEMNQLTEVGIPAWDILSKKMNVSRAALQDLVEKGAVPAGKAIDALVAGMNDRFGGMMEKQSHTMGGLMSTANDLARSIASQLTAGGFDVLSGGIERTVRVMNNFNENLSGLPNRIDSTIPKIGTLTLAFSELAHAVNAATFPGLPQIPTSAQSAEGIRALQNERIGKLAEKFRMSPTDVNTALDMLTQRGMSRADALRTFENLQSSLAGTTGLLAPDAAQLKRLQDSFAPKTPQSETELKRLEQKRKDEQKRQMDLIGFSSDAMTLRADRAMKASAILGPVWDAARGQFLLPAMQQAADMQTPKQANPYAPFGQLPLGDLPSTKLVQDAIAASSEKALFADEQMWEKTTARVAKLKEQHEAFLSSFREGAGRVWDTFTARGLTALQKITSVARMLLDTIGRTLFQNFATGLLAGGRSGGGGGLGGAVAQFGAGLGGKFGISSLFGGAGASSAVAGSLAPGAMGILNPATGALVTGGPAGAGGLGGALGLGGGAGLFGLGAATIPVVGGAIVGAMLLSKFLGPKAPTPMTADPWAQIKDRTMWFNTTFPFERLTSTMEKLNDTMTGVDHTMQQFDTMEEGVVVKNGLPAARRALQDAVRESFSDRKFRRSISGAITEQAL